MNQDRSGWVIGIIFIAFFVLLYFVNSYDELFDRYTAYLYDPESDDVYMVEMAPHLGKYAKWDVFIPFNKLYYVEPDGAEYIGKLHVVIAEYQADMKLLRNNIEAWKKKGAQEREQIILDSSKDGFEIELLDISYYTRQIEDVKGRMSDTLSNIFEDSDLKLKSDEIIVVDAVISKRIISSERDVDKPVSIKIIREALLFKRTAAYILSNQGL